MKDEVDPSRAWGIFGDGWGIVTKGTVEGLLKRNFRWSFWYLFLHDLSFDSFYAVESKWFWYCKRSDDGQPHETMGEMSSGFLFMKLCGLDPNLDGLTSKQLIQDFFGIQNLKWYDFFSPNRSSLPVSGSYSQKRLCCVPWFFQGRELLWPFFGRRFHLDLSSPCIILWKINGTTQTKLVYKKGRVTGLQQ